MRLRSTMDRKVSRSKHCSPLASRNRAGTWGERQRGWGCGVREYWVWGAMLG